MLKGGVVVDLQGAIAMEDCVVDHLPAIVLHDGRIEITRSRLGGQSQGGSGASPVILAINGQLDLDAVIIEPAVSGMTGLELRGGANVTLRDVAIRGVAMGVKCDGARIPAINGLTVTAVDVGLSWRGTRDPAWSWERLQLQAAKPSQGLELEATTEGARPERLGLVPVGQVATVH
jgi:hypothetical protein